MRPHRRAVGLERCRLRIRKRRGELGRDAEAADDRHALTGQVRRLRLLTVHGRPTDDRENALTEEPVRALVRLLRVVP